MLDAEEEYMLAKNWKERGNLKAAHKLVTSHLRLVAKIAMGYRGYGLPVSELISEGNIGLMQAVKKFDPDKRVSTCNICNVVDKSFYSRVCSKILEFSQNGNDNSTKETFFNLKKLKIK